MVIARVKGYNGVQSLAVGLVKGDMDDLLNGLKAGYINTAMEHIIDIMKEMAVAERIIKLNMTGVYPSFNDETEEEYTAEMNFPIIVVTIRLGSMRESGVGRTFVDSEDGVVKSFVQPIMVEFDCVGPDAKTVDAAVSFLTLTAQIKKIDFIKKGFHDIKTTYSKPALGWENVIPWDFPERWFRFKLLRHLVHMSASFDVTWLEVPDSTELITQVVFENETEIEFPFLEFGAPLEFGVSLAYLIVEDEEFNMHGIYDEV